ncbi:MAG: hypothetical protein P8Z35_08475 [Ignavibacteriaceae bacterium]
MNKDTKSIILSMVLPLLFIVVVFSPVGILGYRNREIAAVGIAIISIILGFILSVINLKRRMSGRPFNPTNLICAFILALPSLYLLLHYN